MRFYFDVDDGENTTLDEDGDEFASLKEARDEAIGLLPALAREVLPDGDRRIFVVKVRDEKKRPVFIATLTLVAESLV